MTESGWGVGKITLFLYPLGAGTAAINLYFAGLLLSWLDMAVPSPGWAIFLGCILGVPLTWLFARHIKNLMNRADAGAD